EPRAREAQARCKDELLPDPEEGLVAAEALAARLREAPAVHVREVDTEVRGLHIPCRPVPLYAGDLRRLISDLPGREGKTILLLGNAGRANRLGDVLREE